MGTAAQVLNSNATEVEKKQAVKDAIDEIKGLMDVRGVTKPEQQKANGIFDAVLKFLENTDFNPNKLPAHKY